MSSILWQNIVAMEKMAKVFPKTVYYFAQGNQTNVPFFISEVRFTIIRFP